MPKMSFDVKKINDNLYSLDENHQANGFLVIGKEKACVIDTMYGISYSFADIRKLTDKPIIVINTHAHGDHVWGNIHFDKAYIHDKDLDEANKALKKARMKFPKRWFNYKCAEFMPIKEGDVIDIGGLTLKIYELAGHTKGGIVVLCPELRVLFSGDGINHHLYMFLDGCTSIKEMADNLKRIQFLEKEADYILHGHSMDLNDSSLISYLIQGAEDYLAGNTSKDELVKIMGKNVRKHPFEVDPNGNYNSPEHFIFCPGD